MSSDWKVLVRLHNVVNIPRDVCVNAGPGDARVFSVIARAASSNGSLLTDCSEVHAEFTTRDIVQASTEGLLEVKFDSRGDRFAATSAEWSIRTPVLMLLLAVKEQGASYARVVGSSSRNLVIDVADVVKRLKLVTHVVGTEMGQIGVSFAVAPSDRVGYRQRLAEFLAQHNPTGLQLVDSVICTVPEVDTFTKLYRKYGVVDYGRRVEEFFRVYGQEHVVQVPSLLQEWENREEELIHNLVLDNGPEPDTIDATERLESFLKAHNLNSSTPDVAHAVREFGDTPYKLFRALTALYGAEPDPRQYLFLPTYYEVMPLEHRQQQQKQSPSAPVRSSLAAGNTLSPHREALSSRLQRQEVQSQQQLPIVAAKSHAEQRLMTANTTKITSANVETSHNQAHHNNNTNSNKGDGNTRSSREPSWDEFCELLMRHGKQPSDVYYMNETLFQTTVDIMGYTRLERDALLQQWRQRLRGALHEENLVPGDAYYDTATKEVLHVVGLQQLNMEVVSVTTVTNREHSSCFASRLSAARERATERLAIIGDYQHLRQIVTHGAGAGDCDVASRENPCAIFYRHPFQNWNRKQATCILICDVVVGRPYVCPSLVRTARGATEEFRKEWDCCVFHDAGGGQAVAVYDPQQVLPRYMVQCHVDVTLTPCPAHPSRAVEYYVLDENTFACSRCVVLGAYRGKEVLAIEDAAVQARSRLSDYKRDAQQLMVDFETCETDLNREVDDMKTAPRRLIVEGEVDRIRREAEERVMAILRELEQKELEDLNAIRLRQERVRKAKGAASVLTENIVTALQYTSPLQVVTALQRVRAEGELLYLKTELQKSDPRFNDGGAITAAAAAPAPAPSALMDTSMDHSDNQKRGGDNSYHNNQGYYIDSTGIVPSHVIDLQQTPVEPTTSSLYAKYLALTSTVGKEEEACSKPMTSNTKVNQKQNDKSNGQSASDMSSCEITRRTKEDITKGWALCRKGDLEGARRVWSDVHERYSDSAVGARAQAYIAEAVERDYKAAAAWYDVSLQLDPSDAMTLYNYGVLLETLLGRREEALMLFERAHSLGDGAAGRRAQQLRHSLRMP